MHRLMSLNTRLCQLAIRTCCVWSVFSVKHWIQMAMMKIIIWRKRTVRSVDRWQRVHTVNAVIRRFKWQSIQSTIQGKVAMFPAFDRLTRIISVHTERMRKETGGFDGSKRDILRGASREVRLFQLPLYTCPDCEAKIRSEENATTTTTTTKNSSVNAQVGSSLRYRCFVTLQWIPLSRL